MKGGFTTTLEREQDEKTVVEVIAVDYDYAFYRGQFYMRNGDPGFPDEEEMSYTVTTDKGDDITDSLTPEEIKKLEQQIRDDANAEDEEDEDEEDE